MKVAGRLSTPEFVGLLALLFSLVALSIDAMLPAIGTIAGELGAGDANDRQLVIGSLFLGLAFGQLVYGPLSDSVGRKAAILAGLTLFVLGSILAAAAQDFSTMLIGRAIQGFGAASPRIVAVAVVRDLYEGRAMARIMSLAMSIFILVPVFAPAVGQAILLFASWRAIFAVLLWLAVAAALWCALRLPETLPRDRRLSLSPMRVLKDIAEVVMDRQALCYTLAGGFVFSAFVAYLQMSQQVFAELYERPTTFPAYFGLLAAAIGLASLVNARLVMRYGMRRLSWWSVVASLCVALAFLGVTMALAGKPPFLAFVGSFMALFFFNGLLFGNFNALSMENMGHIAGTASAVIGSLSTFISILIGGVIGRTYEGSITPLVAGFAVSGLLALSLMAFAEGAPKSTRSQ